MRVYDGAVTKHHRPIPHPIVDKPVQAGVSVQQWGPDGVAEYIAAKYGELPKPERQRGTVITITDEQRRNARKRSVQK